MSYAPKRDARQGNVKEAIAWLIKTRLFPTMALSWGLNHM